MKMPLGLGLCADVSSCGVWDSPKLETTQKSINSPFCVDILWRVLWRNITGQRTWMSSSRTRRG